MANLLKRMECESYPGQFCVVCEDDVEDGERYGWGNSLEEAQAAWAEMVVDRVDDFIFDLAAFGNISKEEAQLCFTSLDEMAWLPY